MKKLDWWPYMQKKLKHLSQSDSVKALVSSEKIAELFKFLQNFNAVEQHKVQMNSVLSVLIGLRFPQCIL